MPTAPFKPIQLGPTGQMSRRDVEEVNRALLFLNKLANIRGDGPIKFHETSTGFNLWADIPEIFPAELTAETSGKYSFTEQVYDDNDGLKSARTAGKTGNATLNPAFELNGQSGIPAGTYVWMMRGHLNNGTADREYQFFYPNLSSSNTATTFENVVTFNNTSTFNNNVTFANQSNFHTLNQAVYYQNYATVNYQNNALLKFPCQNNVTSYPQLPVKTGDGQNPSPGDYQYTKVPNEEASPGALIFSQGSGNQPDRGVWYQWNGTACTNVASDWRKVLTHHDLDNYSRLANFTCATQFNNTVTFNNFTTFNNNATFNNLVTFNNNIIHNCQVSFNNNATAVFNNTVTYNCHATYTAGDVVYQNTVNNFRLNVTLNLQGGDNDDALIQIPTSKRISSSPSPGDVVVLPDGSIAIQESASQRCRLPCTPTSGLEDKSMLLWLRFEDNLDDSSGNNRDFTAGGGYTASYVAGEQGKAIQISAVTHSVFIGDGGIPSGDSTYFACSVRLYIDSISGTATSGRLFQIYRTGDWVLHYSIASGVWSVVARMGGVDVCEVVGELAVGMWHRLFFKVEDGDVTLNVDGNEDTGSGTIAAANSSTVVVGESTLSGGTPTYRVDEVMLWRGATADAIPTAAQITTLQEGGNPFAEPVGTNAGGTGAKNTKDARTNLQVPHYKEVRTIKNIKGQL